MPKYKLKTMDGNTAAAYVAYAFSEIASIYPITPSSVMAELVDKWATMNVKNVFGQKVEVYEMQSEAGAAGTVHGALSAGVLTNTFTASQGLLLMIPNMYKIAGELLPCVIHVSARAIACHALNIFGDHSDVMSCRQTGFAMMAASNVQEVMDLGIICHLSTIKGRIPFLHFFDGFRTSHEMQKIRILKYSDLKKMLDFKAVDDFRKRALNPERPVLRGSAQNSDIFFQSREASNKYYNELPNIVEKYMNIINKKLKTNYSLFNYYGNIDADRIIVAMGSICDTIEEVIDYLNSNNEKVGLIKIRLYRPFDVKKFIQVIPKKCKKIAVLDRTKESGSYAEPIHLDVLAAISNYKNNIKVVGGRYGLGSKDTNPSNIFAVYENLKQKNMKNHFTIGINDDVTHLSLISSNNTNVIPKGTISCKFWGFGSDGTIGANKNSIKIIGDNTDLYVQAYFSYDSKKSGGVTVSHLRFGKEPIKSAYLIKQADFVACHNHSYIGKYNIIEDLKPQGLFLLNCPWNICELDKMLPNNIKIFISKNKINFYIINGTEIAQKLKLGNKINIILQSAFFKITKIIDTDEAINLIKKSIIETYGTKGEKVIKMNYQAILEGINGVQKVNIPSNWNKLKIEEINKNINNIIDSDLNFYVNKILIPINQQKGDLLPVSHFINYVDGTVPQGSSKYEKRGIAIDVPKWIPKYCIQCTHCSYVCPHSAIRPFILNEIERKNAPKKLESIKLLGKNIENFEFNLSISILDCTGCGICAKVCPGYKGNKSLIMNPLKTQLDEQQNFDYCVNNVIDKNMDCFNINTIKGSQFKQPLLEFSGACAGCGETPYAKLLTQLFGARMYIANATGCSSIWGGSSPSTPYTKNIEGHGPAWSNSLFEDNAEFGFGMFLAMSYMREKITILLNKIIKKYKNNFNITNACDNWIKNKDNTEKSLITTKLLINTLSNLENEDAKYIINNKEFLSKKSIWIIGGDGWAYDIGFGGLDHVVASNANVNILIFDTELYSNTGGQASKATPIGQVCKFASSGKLQVKKNLADILMSYEHVYVAQISMGANYNQTIKALIEAENYNGPSVIIAYSPCINHGIKSGMNNVQEVMKNAVLSGYWHLFRRNPELKYQNKNPFILDSNQPSIPYEEFLMSETRYTSLKIQFPDKANTLFRIASENAMKKYLKLKKMAEDI